MLILIEISILNLVFILYDIRSDINPKNKSSSFNHSRYTVERNVMLKKTRMIKSDKTYIPSTLTCIKCCAIEKRNRFFSFALSKTKKNLLGNEMLKTAHIKFIQYSLCPSLLCHYSISSRKST